MEVRTAQEPELDRLARIWYDGWQDGHAAILPAELARHRTLESFRDRLQAALSTVRLAGPVGTPVGFCMVEGDELYQLYVSASARGSGVAAALMAGAEGRFRANGVGTAWLACAIGTSGPGGFMRNRGGVGWGP